MIKEMSLVQYDKDKGKFVMAFYADDDACLSKDEGYIYVGCDGRFNKNIIIKLMTIDELRDSDIKIVKNESLEEIAPYLYNYEKPTSESMHKKAVESVARTIAEWRMEDR